ncbi:MAG: TIGR02186 family protein [Hyphomicrobiales bacterium]|nr:TIGR02186 family protein [Hyphomicrobiales bacterium]
MMRLLLRTVATTWILVECIAPAAAERLIASLSSHRVMVTSSFTGAELVLFGGIEQDAASRPRRGGYDIVVTVTGPRQDAVTFRKSRVLGIWVNSDSRTFDDVPAYLAVLSNRPLDALANAETLRRLQLGLDNVPLPQLASVNIADAASDDPFRIAFINLKSKSGLYRETPNGVTFLTPALYRASIQLPAEVPVGTYEVDVRLFADGAQIARAPSPFEVYKSGFEQIMTTAARDHGLLYGLATAMMAIVTGWFASVVFRRD